MLAPKKTDYKECFFKLNYDLMIHNPISKTFYVIFIAIDTCHLILTPIIILFGCISNPQHTYADQLKVSLQLTDYYNAFTYAGIGFFISIFFLYIGLYLKLIQQGSSNQYSSARINLESSISPHFYRILMLMILLSQKVIRMPFIILFFKMIVSFGMNVENKANIEIQILVVVSQIIEVVLTMLFHNFLTMAYPINDIPWAKPYSQFMSIMMIQKYVLALCYALPMQIPAVAIAYVISLALNTIYLIMTIKEMAAYDKFAQTMLLIQQSFMITSSLFLVMFSLEEVVSFSLIKIISYFMIVITIFGVYYKLKKYFLYRSAFSTDIKEFRVANRYVASVIKFVDVQQNSSLLQLQSYVLYLITQGSKHKKQCDFEPCKCKLHKYSKQFNTLNLKTYLDSSIAKSEVARMRRKIQKMLVILMEFTMDKYFKQHVKKGNRKDNEHLKYLILFKKFECQPSSYSNLYKLLEVHDKRNSSLNNTFTQYQLKCIIMATLIKEEETKESLVDFDASIAYENLLRKYCQNIQEISVKIQEYWNNTLKSLVNIKQTDLLAKSILDQYKFITSIYSQIKSQCGDVLSVELLTWRYYKDVLSFEEETDSKFEQIKCIIDKVKVLRNSSEAQNQFSYQNSKFGLIVVSANPKNFQEILLSNKFLLLMSGYHEEQIFGQNLSVLLPKMVDQVHDKYVVDYLEQQKSSSEVTQLFNMFLKCKDETLQQIDIKVNPKVTLENELILITFIQNSVSFKLFDRDLVPEEVFFIMANDNDRILHYSKNCLTILNFNYQLIQNDVRIEELFPQLDKSNEELFNDEVGTIIELNTNQIMLMQLDQSDETMKDKYKRLSSAIAFQGDPLKLSVRIHCKKREISKDNHLYYYSFVLMNSISPDNQKNSLYLDCTVKGDMDDRRQCTIASRNIPIGYTTSSIEYQSLDISSVSSGSSSYNSENLAYKQVLEIKSTLDFSKLPEDLKRFRILLIVVFIVLILTCAALFIVNYISTQNFFRNVDAVRNMKTLRSAFTNSKLMLIMYEGSINIPNTNISSDLISFMNVSAQTDLIVPFGTLLSQFSDQIHNELNIFSQHIANWDSNFVSMVTKDKIHLQQILSDGQTYIFDQIFINGLQNYIAKIDAFGTTSISDVKIPANIFEVNTDSEYFRLMKILPNKQKSIVENMFYCFKNGAGELTDQFLNLDKSFMNRVYSEGNSLIEGIMFFTWIFCVIIFAVTLVIIPFFFRIDTLYLKAMQYYLYIDPSVIRLQVLKLNEFLEYIQENKYISQNMAIHNPPPPVNNINNTSDHQSQHPKEEFKKKSNNNNSDKLSGVFDENKASQSQGTKGTFGQQNKFKQYMKKRVQKKLIEETKKEDESEETVSEINLEKENEEKESKLQTIEKMNSLDEMKRITNQKLNSNSIVGKVKVVIAIYLVSAILCIFYFLIYTLSKTIYSNFQTGFHEFEVHYSRIPCLTDSFYYLQYNLYENNSFDISEPYGSRLSDIIDSCYANEVEYKQIRYQANHLFSKTNEKMKILDSNDPCSLYDFNATDKQECQDSMRQFINVDSLSYMADFISHIQIKSKTVEAIPMSQRTVNYNIEQFYELNTFRDITILSKYILKMLKSICDYVQSDFEDRIKSDFKKIATLFSVFICFQIIIQILCQNQLISKMKQKLLRIKLLLKLIPSSEIISLKLRLGNINTKQL